MSERAKFCKVAEWKPSSVFKKKYLTKAIKLLKKIEDSPELRRWCSEFSVFEAHTENNEIESEINCFVEASYSEGLVVTDYQEYLDRMQLSPKIIEKAEASWLESLTLCQLLSVLAYHFRKDYHCSGSLINESLASGAMYRIILELDKRF